MAEIKFTCTGESENISAADMDTIYEYAPNGITIKAKDEETPMCWDAVFEVEEIESGSFIIQGGVGPSGYGKVTISLPKKDAESFYDLIIEPDDTIQIGAGAPDTNYSTIKNILNKYKFKILE